MQAAASIARSADGFRDRESVRVGGGPAALSDEAARLDDPIESAPIDGQIAHHRERRRPKRFNGDDVAIVELPHVELAGGAPPGP